MPLAEEQLEVLQDLFHKIDKEGVFSVNANELEEAVKREISDGELQASALHSISTMDRNDDGSISFVEFVSTIKRDIRSSEEKPAPEEKEPEAPATETSSEERAEGAAPAATEQAKKSADDGEKKEKDEEAETQEGTKAQPKAEEEPIIKEGPLLKEGEIFKTWKKRHFVLRKGLMTYHEKKGGKLIKSFAFDKAVVGVSSPEVRKKKGNKKNLFEIVTKTRTWYLAADTDEETKSWVDVLVNQCGCTNREAVQVTSDANEDEKPEKEKDANTSKEEKPTETKQPDAEPPAKPDEEGPSAAAAGDDSD